MTLTRSQSNVVLLLFLLLLGFDPNNSGSGASAEESIAEVVPSGGVVSIRRTVDTSIISRMNTSCNFSGGTIVLGGPSSLEEGDKYYFPSYRQRLGYNLVLDYVNRHRCGVQVGGKQYKIELQTYDDQSSTSLTEAIAHKLVKAPYSSSFNSTIEDPVDLMVAGYSSALTKPLSTVVANYNQQQQQANSTNNGKPRLLMCAGSALTSNFKDRPYVYTTAVPVAKFIRPAMEGLATQTTAKTIATVFEDVGFAKAACGAAPDLSNEFGMDLVSEILVEETPSVTVLDPVATQLKELDPDVVITCVYDCIPWHTAMRNANWSPKAQVFTICIGDQSYKEVFGSDVEYMMGVVQWDQSVKAKDALTGWTSQEYAQLYKALSSDAVVVEAATLGSAMISIIIQAMEATNTITDAAVLSDYLNTHTFQTMHGDLSFDENGQSALSLLLVQYDQEGILQTTYPIEKSSGDIVYPMPTWDGRDCVHLSNCVKIHNTTCTVDGYCECPEGFTTTGFGSTAGCLSNEYYNQLTGGGAGNNSWSSPGVIFGIVAACLVATGMILWAMIQQKKRQNDAVWKVNKEEIKFDDPPVVVGQGTFGVVLLGEYRGTEVAVKRVIPPKKNDGGKDGMESSVVVQDGMLRTSITNQGGGSLSTSITNHAQGGLLNTSITSTSNGRARYEKTSTTSGTASGLVSGTGSRKTEGIFQGFTGNWNYTSTQAERRKLERDFISEMRYLSKLRHPSITTVMGAVIKKGEDPMLVMEYMYHGSLYDILHNNTMVLEGEILLPIMRDISSGLRFLHASNPQIIHGDLKAANILVDSKFRAKVADFGLSQKHKLGAAAGTPFWMAPELLRGTSVNTAASDMYAYGIILYEVFSRKEPYEGEDAREVVKQVADPNINKRPPVPLNCPPLAEGLMNDCLVEDPGERPTFEEVNMRLKRMDISKLETGTQHNKATISLFDIFPRHIAEALRDGREVESEHKEVVTIFFSDIVGFTNISATLEPKKVALMLDRLYTRFDHLSCKHDIFKVETIGDAYMAVTNLVKEQPTDHTKRIAMFAMDAIEAANETQIDEDDPSKGFVNIRVGFHSGPVVADVVGSRNPRYCLFGDTVNTASRMESTSKVNSIHCSAVAAKLLKEQDSTIPIRSRGVIEVKGKGKQLTYWVNQRGARKSEIALNKKAMLQSVVEGSQDFASGRDLVLEEVPETAAVRHPPDIEAPQEAGEMPSQNDHVADPSVAAANLPRKEPIDVAFVQNLIAKSDASHEITRKRLSSETSHPPV